MPPNRSIRILLLGLSLAGLVSSCTHYSGIDTPKYDLESDRFQEGAKLDYQDPGNWWQAFGAPELDRFMAESLQENPLLRAARARLMQSFHLSETSFANSLPMLGLNYDKTQVSGETMGIPYDSTTHRLNLSLSYELDLFGKNKSFAKAQELNAMAAIETYRIALQDHAKQVAKAWLRLAESKASLELSEESLLADQANRELIHNSYRLGSAGIIEMLQAEEQELVTRTSLDQLNMQLSSQIRALNLLAGRFPKDQGSVFLSLDRIQLPTLGLGVPSELLQRRPDIRRAMLTLLSQDQLVANAVANRYPRLTLTASKGYSNDQYSDLTDPENAITNLVGGLTAPLFDWGSRAHTVLRQKAMVKETHANYQQTLLGAIKEVMDLQDRIESAQRRIRILKTQAKLGKERLELTKDGFIQGTHLWSQVISTQAQYFNAKRNLIATKREWMEAQIDLYAALGGSWTDRVILELGPEIAELAKEEP